MFSPADNFIPQFDSLKRQQDEDDDASLGSVTECVDELELPYTRIERHHEKTGFLSQRI